MKLTLLQIVQKTLNSLSSDEVSTIAETVESAQITDIVEDVFYTMVSNKTIPEHEGLARLESPSDALKPNYLRLTDTTVRIKSIRYNISETPNTKTEYRKLIELSPEAFLQRMVGLDSASATVTTVIDYNNTKLLCHNDKFPSYWTTFDDEYIIFDAFKSSLESTVQLSKTLVITHKVPTFSKTDAFVPDIDDNLFPLLLNEVKSWAHLELKQNVHPKAEQAVRTQKLGYQRFRDRVGKDDTGRDYGR